MFLGKQISTPYTKLFAGKKLHLLEDVSQIADETRKEILNEAHMFASFAGFLTHTKFTFAFSTLFVMLCEDPQQSF